MPGYDGKLFVLTFDHRASFTRDPFGFLVTPTPAEAARVSEAKEIILEGFLRALAAGAPRNARGVHSHRGPSQRGAG